MRWPDLLVDGAGHTFIGRMVAWCPDAQREYNVSLQDMGEMSEEARYFVRGFLSGNEPGPPYDQDGEIDPVDLDAWRSAIRRFRRTGWWFGRWGTCATCGCVLLPDSAGPLCDRHRSPETLK